MTNEKQNLLSSARALALKRGRVVAYDEGNSPMMSHNPLTTWLRVVVLQIESFISPIPQSL